MPPRDQIDVLLRPLGLCMMGTCGDSSAPLPEGVKTLVLLGPEGGRFWDIFTQSPEYLDGHPNPMDRWSRRVIDALALQLGARAFYPFGTVPPHPFITWAQASGRAWSSPVHLLVHDKAGLWASYRGALGLPTSAELPTPATQPCTACARPCVTACPAAALTADGYDIAACHAYLDTAEGQDCMQNGCAVRAVCPASQAHGRVPEHSAFHMRYFHT